MRKINIKKAKELIKGSIRRKFEETNKEKAIFGYSGGLDSSTLALILKESLGKEKVLGILMPEVEDKESRNLAEKMNIKYEIIPLKQIIETKKLDYFCKDQMAKGNLMARTRMMILYYISNCNNGLVVGTSNKSELYTGYFTKFGDGASDYRPLADLYKTEIRKLAKELNVPQRVLDKKPSADFWEGQTDEDELGIKYKDLDEILYYYIDKENSEKEIKKKFNEKKAQRVFELVKRSSHKRKLPEEVKINKI